MNGANHAALLNADAMEQAVTQDVQVSSAPKTEAHGAVAELYAIYSQRLYRTIITITRNPEDAEDALQDTFLRAYIALHTFEGRSSVYSWLTQIAINSALMILRKRRIRSEILFDPQPDDRSENASFEFRDSSPSPEEMYNVRQLRARLIRAIRKLSPCLRKPIQLRLEKESSLKEIGQTLNISAGAVKARLHRARLRLSAPCRGL
jgi:RNA polymerase sigma-70 factor, ECF subfamily